MVTIDGYVIDASLTEGHKFAATVTKYPIESGSSIADSVVKDPLQVTIEGVVSDTPLGSALQARQQSQTQVDATLEFLPSDEALARLTAIYDAEEPVTVETSLKRFENMVLVDLDIPVDGDTGDALHFTATFEQVTIVTNNRAAIRVASPNCAKKVSKARPTKVHTFGAPKTLKIGGSQTGAVYNDQKGRFEYGSVYDSQGKPLPNAQPNGVPVPQQQLQSAMDDHNRDVAHGITDPPPGSYYDYQRDEWMNTNNNTPVTQQQLGGIRTSPWYK